MGDCGAEVEFMPAANDQCGGLETGAMESHPKLGSGKLNRNMKRFTFQSAFSVRSTGKVSFGQNAQTHLLSGDA